MTTTDSTYDWLQWGLKDCPNGRLPPDLNARRILASPTTEDPWR
jgi:hypothetical protein